MEAEFEADSEPSDRIPGPWDKWHPPKSPKVVIEQDTNEFKGEIELSDLYYSKTVWV